MRLKIKDMDIETGGRLVAILNQKDAACLNLHFGDRVKIKKNSFEVVAVLDIAESKKTVLPGKIGLFDEVLKILKAKNNDEVSISIEKKPKSLHFIKKKLDGKRLSSEEIQTIVNDIVSNDLTSVELTYFVSASYIYGLDLKETTALTKAIINTGKILKPGKYPIFDKHCIGGVAGNRTTPIVVPILVAAGYCVPKTSSRSITSPAGTADAMEVIAKVDLSLDEIKKVVKKTGGCLVWGGAVSLAPADDRIINVEHPLSIDAEGQLLASILAKKGSVSASHVLIDIPVGKGAKIENRAEAKHLKKMFRKIGKGLGMKIQATITDGSQPIGNGLGPALEAKDVLLVLKNDPAAPQDLKRKALHLATELMKLYPPKGKKPDQIHHYATQILESGKAFNAFAKIVKAQGLKTLDAKKIKTAKHKLNFDSPKSGHIFHIDSKILSDIAFAAGAPTDKTAGLYLHNHVGKQVNKGEKIYTIYAESSEKLSEAKAILKANSGVEIK